MRHSDLNWVLPDRHTFPSVVAVGAIALWTCQAYCVKKAREKANIPAPATTGDEELEKSLVSYNHTSEGLAPVICSTYLCSYFTCPKIALGLGAGWVVSRMLGSCKNYCDKEKDCKWMKCVHLCFGHACHIGLLLASIFGIGVSISNRNLLIKGA